MKILTQKKQLLIFTLISLLIISAVSAAEPQITLNSPSDGATDVSLNPTLNATVTDADGDLLDVSFYESNWSYVTNLTKAEDYVYAVSFSPNENHIAYGGWDNNVHIHNTNDWNLEQTLAQAGDSIWSVSFSPNENYIAYGSLDGNVYIHNTNDWSLEQTLTQETYRVNSVSFSPNGNYIAYGGRDENIYLHNTNDWSLENTLSQAGDGINSISFSSDGNYIAYGTGYQDQNVYVHKTNDWSLENTLTESTSVVNSVSFSPNGKYVAYGSGDKNVYIHNTNDWSLEQNLTRAGGSVYTVSFSPNANYIAYGSNDDNVYVHNTNDWSHLGTLIKSTGMIMSLSLSPDSNYIAYGEGYGGDNNYIHVHELGSVLLDLQTGISSGSDITYEWYGLVLNRTYDWFVEVTDGTSTTRSNIWNFTTTFTLPLAQSFTSNPRTTNFSEVSNVSEVQNLTLATNYGTITFGNETVNAKGQDYDSNVVFGDCFVAVKSENLDSTFNATAYLLMNNSDGHCGDNTIFTSNDFAADAGAVKTTANICKDCKELTVNGDLVKYRVPHFSSYAIGSNSNMTIDANDPKAVNQTVTFTAVYRNSSAPGDFISGANCQIGLQNGTTSSMAEGTEQYTFQTSFTSNGTYTYNVTCEATGYQTLKTDDNFTITQQTQQIPEFNTIAILALLAVIGIIIYKGGRK